MFINITFFSLLSIMTKICLWFYTGVKLYSLLEKGFFGFSVQKQLEIIQRLSFFELFLIFVFY